MKNFWSFLSIAGPYFILQHFLDSASAGFVSLAISVGAVRAFSDQVEGLANQIGRNNKKGLFGIKGLSRNILEGSGFGVRRGSGEVFNIETGETVVAGKQRRSRNKFDFLSPQSQSFLPPSLREGQTGDILQSGIQGIGQLIQNPGGLNPNIAQAINARVGQESGLVAQNFRGLEQEQAGAAARSNLPVSIKNALSSALGIAQERAQRGVRSSALSESEGLRRGDLGQTFNVMDAILQFLSSGRGNATAGLSAAGQLNFAQQGLAQQGRSANLSFLGSLLSNPALGKTLAKTGRTLFGRRGGGGGGGGEEDNNLSDAALASIGNSGIF